jgi:hypothetical protein
MKMIIKERERERGTKLKSFMREDYINFKRRRWLID